MWLWIKPLDVLLFRDSRPFTGGESHRARSLFPPSPLTFQGAIRAVLLGEALRKAGSDFPSYRHHLKQRALQGSVEGEKKFDGIVDTYGDEAGFGRLQLHGPFLARRDGDRPEPFFPVPYDLFLLSEREGMGEAKGEKSVKALSLTPLRFEWRTPPICDENWPDSFLFLWSREAVEEAAGYWLSTEGLKRYLRDEETDRLEPSRSFYKSEPRFGIRLQRERRTVEIGMLYMADFIRLRNKVGFLLEIDAEEEGALEPLKGAGLLALGGERRAARYEEISDDPLGELKEMELEGNTGKVFKLYLASPAIFTRGWVPDFLDLGRDLKGTVEGVEVRLIAAAVGKPLHIGGWDLALGKPKDLRRAVPPGSVYYFKILKGDFEKIFRKFHLTCELQGLAGEEGLKELRKVGFGLALVGVVREGGG